MSTCRFVRLTFAVMVATGVGLLSYTSGAQADDYTDLLDLLRSKGTLTQSEYDGLLAKHLKHLKTENQARAQSPPTNTLGTSTPDTALAQAQSAAASAAASAQAAQQAQLTTQAALNRPDVVKFENYVPGKGISLDAGPVTVNLSGYVNGFYTFNRPSQNGTVAGGLSTGATRYDSSSVRNGFLPAALIFKISTTQAGIDFATVFGMYPGIDSATNGSYNANSGGSPVGLGTSGIDFRQIYFTAGTSSFGTVKVGRDLGIFGSDAILDDATLLSLGSTGSNSSPGNTSLGRIGTGYVYADWLPQISYASPKFGGFQATVGIMSALDEVNYAGSSLSATSVVHSSPMFQGKLTYDFSNGPWSERIWAGFLTQNQQHLAGANIPTDKVKSAIARAGELGTKVTYGPVEGVLYYYRGSGLGTTGLFFDGFATNGNPRTSQGYYAQVSYKATDRLKLVGSYGASELFQASGEYSPSLVRRNESEILAAYYSLTSNLSLIGEFSHTNSISDEREAASDNSISGGAMLSF